MAKEKPKKSIAKPSHECTTAPIQIGLLRGDIKRRNFINIFDWLTVQHIFSHIRVAATFVC